jgi:hypothetical protein
MLSFLAAALERVIVAEYQQILADKLSHMETRLWKIDRALTACPKCHAMKGLADLIQELHVGLAEIVAAAQGRGQAADFALRAQDGATTKGDSPSSSPSASLTPRDRALWRRKLRDRPRRVLDDQPENLAGCLPGPTC